MSTTTEVTQLKETSFCTNGDGRTISSVRSSKNLGTNKKYKFLIWEFETEIIWFNVFFMLFWHIVALYGIITHPYLKSPGIVIYCLIIYGIAGFGGTAGAHRYWTHKSFKAKLPLRIILLICYSMCGMNSIKDWVRDHRVHHKYSDTDADPHNAKRGFFFSHMGWLMMKKHPEVITKGKLIDCSDIFEDPLVSFHQRYYGWFKLLFCFVLPTIIPPFLYGESWYNSIMGVCFVKYLLSLHAVWSVNSFAHLWGTKPYNKDIYPAENYAVSFFAMGEGYHNYHHTFPWDYRTAEMGSKLNAATFWLNFFQKIGWAYDMKTPSPQLIEKTVKSNGDSSHYKWGQEVPVEENEKFADIVKKSM